MQVSKKIKLIQVIADSALGGGPRHVLALLKNIDKEKFDPLLIAPRGWLTSEVVKIKEVGVRIVEFKSKYDLNSIIKLKKNIAEFRASGNPFAPIIVHAHGPRAGNFSRFALRPGEKFVYTEHIWNEDFRLKNPLNTFLQRNGLKSIYTRADLIIAVSNSVKRFLIRTRKQLEAKIKVIPNAVELSDLGKEKTRRPGRERDSELIVGTIGSLVPQKGQIYLVRAFARVHASLPKARLEIIGAGPSKDILREEIQGLGLESKIQLLGEQKNVEKFISQWDLFVLPSLSETFGLVILEAMEHRVPVIASSVGGIPEIIKDGKTGVLVPPADAERLAKAISGLLAEKKDRESLAAEAFTALKKNFDWGKIINKIEEEYQSLTR